MVLRKNKLTFCLLYCLVFHCWVCIPENALYMFNRGIKLFVLIEIMDDELTTLHWFL